MKRFAPLAFFLAISGAWAHYSIRPRVADAKRLSANVEQLESAVAEWKWIESAPDRSRVAPPKVTLTARELTQKVSACRVILANLNQAANGTSNIEIRSSFPSLIIFLESITDLPCQIVSIRKNEDGTLTAAITMETM